MTASDASHYLGVSPVRIKKFTNGEDADEPPGPSIVVGSPITWRYVVTNIGLTPLSAISVVDDKGETVVCPSTGTLAPGATMTCSATGTAALGFYRNVGTVTATRTIGGITATVTDSDPSHYLGVLPDEDDGGPKVTLCHKTGNGSFHSITVSVNAEPAHRKHGDGKPGEAVPGQSGKIFGPDLQHSVGQACVITRARERVSGPGTKSPGQERTSGQRVSLTNGVRRGYVRFTGAASNE